MKIREDKDMIKGIDSNTGTGVPYKTSSKAGTLHGDTLSMADSKVTEFARRSHGDVLEAYRKEGVDLTLSEEAEEREAAAGKTEKAWEKELNNLKEMYQEQLEAAKESAEAMGEGFEDMGKALEIARRMMHGDQVPGSDEKFLMDYNKDIYMGAKNMQMIARNEKSKKYDSILEEEEEKKEGARNEGDTETVDASGLNLPFDVSGKLPEPSFRAIVD